MNEFSRQISPLDQFEIKNLLSLDDTILANLSLSTSNIGLHLIIGIALVFIADITLSLIFKATSSTSASYNYMQDVFSEQIPRRPLGVDIM